MPSLIFQLFITGVRGECPLTQSHENLYKHKSSSEVVQSARKITGVTILELNLFEAC